MVERLLFFPKNEFSDFSAAHTFNCDCHHQRQSRFCPFLCSRNGRQVDFSFSWFHYVDIHWYHTHTCSSKLVKPQQFLSYSQIVLYCSVFLILLYHPVCHLAGYTSLKGIIKFGHIFNQQDCSGFGATPLYPNSLPSIHRNHFKSSRHFYA